MPLNSTQVEDHTLRQLLQCWTPEEGVAKDPAAPIAGRPNTAAQGWRACGAAALTAGGGTPPGDVIARTRAVGRMIGHLSRRLGVELTLDGPDLLVERERHCAVRHQPGLGRTLRGGGRMMAAADGWIALNFSRPTDLELVPALTDGSVAPTGSWDEQLSAWLARRSAVDVLARATLLGLACGVVPPMSPSRATDGAPVLPALQYPCPFPGSVHVMRRRTVRPLHEVIVADLSLLWAGPLTGSLFAQAGAHVVRVRAAGRTAPVPPQDLTFDRRLHGRKQEVEVDFNDPSALQAVTEAADVVITSMRAGALDRLGWAPRPDQVWLAISGHGVRGQGAARIGFGDDCAADAGLVTWHDGIPAFAADAVADPLTGLLTTAAGLGMLLSGQGGSVDMNLTDVARWAGSLPRVP